MARGSKGGSTGSLDVVGAVTAVPCIVSAGKKSSLEFKDCAEITAWPASLLHEAGTDCSKVGGANLGQQAE